MTTKLTAEVLAGTKQLSKMARLQGHLRATFDLDVIDALLSEARAAGVLREDLTYLLQRTTEPVRRLPQNAKWYDRYHEIKARAATDEAKALEES